MARIPNSRPKASQGKVIEAAKARWVKDNPEKPFPVRMVVAVRSYYDRTIAPDGNNYGDFDDAAFVITPDSFSSWNFNTDPSRLGWNPNAGKYMARLKPGCYKFVRLMHRRSYPAFGQGPNPVTVERIRKDGTVALTETGEFGINNHKGGVLGTSSEGCLTVPLFQWPAYYREVDTSMLRDQSFDFILLDGPLD